MCFRFTGPKPTRGLPKQRQGKGLGLILKADVGLLKLQRLQVPDPHRPSSYPRLLTVLLFNQCHNSTMHESNIRGSLLTRSPIRMTIFKMRLQRINLTPHKWFWLTGI